MAKRDYLFKAGEEIAALYKVVCPLGQGAFGDVYQVEWKNRRGTQQGALKILLDPDLTLGDLMNETNNWARVSQHKNVLRFIAANEFTSEYGRLRFILSDLADTSLEKWFLTHSNNQPPLETSVRMILEILDGLEHLHDNDIFHRDLKPANILLKGEIPLLADFGLARTLDVFSSNRIGGTLIYSPPELVVEYLKAINGRDFQAERNEHHDLWSVSVTFYQMLTGKLPFERLDYIVNQAPKPLPFSIPEEIQAILLRALQKNVADRFQTVSEMKEFFGRWNAKSKKNTPSIFTPLSKKNTHNIFIPLAVGAVLEGRYKLIEDEDSKKKSERHLLGKGDFGAVYLAHDLFLDSKVVLKQILHPTDKNLLLIFKREVEFLSRLKHDCLPRVSNAFQDSASIFIVMDLIRGDDLRERVEKSGKLSFEDIRSITFQLLDVLDYLHKQNIIHKDIKPANLKLTPNGKLKLLDFGFAKGSAGLMSVHQETIIKNAMTVNFASPEQLNGKPTTPQSDLYSTAATIYFLATGIEPSDANRRASEIAIYGTDLLGSLEKMNPQLPIEFAAVFNEALSLDARKRPQSAAEVLERLRKKTPGIEIKEQSETKKDGGNDEAKKYFNIAYNCAEKNDYENAIINYNKAIELKPDYAEAYKNRGNAYTNKGDYDQAIKDYNKAIVLKPDYASSYRNRAKVYEKKGDLVKAQADRQKSDELEKKK